ncbi:hypothetical protein [Kitasatospora sp. NPDC093102]|uniref:hypothetical protein n=1 Tax=Kitasatospora sp. NPDC093102 TaxID=3155069 RepID=UPI00343BC54D
MARKRNKRAHTPTHCAAAEPVPLRPRPYRPLVVGETAVVVVVVVLTVALAAALVATGMSAGAAFELAAGGCLLAARLRRERA